MTYAEIIREMAAAGGTSERAMIRAMRQLRELIGHSIETGESLHLPGVGTFTVAELKPRNVVLPGTDTVMQVPARRAVKFRAADKLKRRVKP